jgi:hypothetical protein
VVGLALKRLKLKKLYIERSGDVNECALIAFNGTPKYIFYTVHAYGVLFWSPKLSCDTDIDSIELITIEYPIPYCHDYRPRFIQPIFLASCRYLHKTKMLEQIIAEVIWTSEVCGEDIK